MKRLILLATNAFILLSVNAQNPNFGLANLKLYSSLDLINSIGYMEKTPKIKNYTDYFEYIHNKDLNIVYEVVNDSTRNDNYNGYFNPNVRFFIIPKYKLINDLYMNKLELVFYKNRLIKIKCNGASELDEALNIKYGEGVLKAEHEDKVFTFVYTGVKITKTEDRYTTTWNVNSSDIKCCSLIWKYYNDEGKENYINNFEFYDIKLMNDVYSQEEIIKQRIKDRINEAKKASLQGL